MADITREYQKKNHWLELIQVFEDIRKAKRIFTKTEQEFIDAAWDYIKVNMKIPESVADTILILGQVEQENQLET